jgi:hypothetical protein
MYASSRASGDADDSRAPPDGAGAALCAVWRDARIKRRAFGARCVDDVAPTRREHDDDDDDDDDGTHDPSAHARTQETPRDVACAAKDIPRRRRRRRRRARE